MFPSLSTMKTVKCSAGGCAWAICCRARLRAFRLMLMPRMPWNWSLAHKGMTAVTTGSLVVGEMRPREKKGRCDFIAFLK